jgi:hypothetical protein
MKSEPAMVPKQKVADFHHNVPSNAVSEKRDFVIRGISAGREQIDGGHEKNDTVRPVVS